MSDAEVIYWYLAEAGPEGAGLIDTNSVDWLSSEEQARLVGMRFPKRRAEWLLGRMTAKTLLTRSLPALSGFALNQITIANHTEGAPFVKVDGQTLPIQLSISHREGMAAAGLSTNPEISLGIDLEWVEDHPHSFYEDFFTTGEVNLLAEVSSERLAWTGTLIWSAKEAMLKALGKGLRLDTRTVDVTGISRTTVDGWGSIDMRIANSNDSNFQGVWRERGPYILTVAIRNAINRPVFHRID